MFTKLLTMSLQEKELKTACVEVTEQYNFF